MRIIPILALGVLLSVSVLAQTGQQTTPSQGQKSGHAGMMMGQKPGQSGGMSASCQEMMQERQKMMSDMQQMDSQLRAKVAAMNSATGDKKIQAIADAVNELASQRHQMFARMQDMQTRMMTHMAQHMESGGPKALANCPMMQQGMGQAGMQVPRGTASKPATSKGKAE